MVKLEKIHRFCAIFNEIESFNDFESQKTGK